MRVHYIQHVAFEGLGFIKTWLDANHYNITVTRTWMNDPFPSIDEFDVLIIMGGPMGVYDDDIHTWLPAEKKLISDAIKEGKGIIGICLGAQLLASVLGAPVYKNTVKEIGWFPVQFTPEFQNWLGSPIPESLTVFHWHGDKFDNPAGGIIHASTQGCDHQIFTLGDKMIGIQFHLEANPASVRDMLHHGSDELIKDQFVQDTTTITSFQVFDEPNDLMAKILYKVCQSSQPLL